MKKIYIYSLLLLTVISFSACDDYLDVKPKDRLIPTTGAEFRGLLTRAYNGLPTDKGIICLRTDELKLNEDKYDLTEVQDIFQWKDVNYSANTIPFSYQHFYKVIMYANHVIHEGPSATEASAEEVDQIVGEAYLLRAYMHFLLVNQYAKPYNSTTAQTDRGIPLSLEIDTEAEYYAASVAEVYAQILSDVEEGQKLMNVESYVTGMNYRFSKVAALAFQARLHLYMGELSKAKEFALEVLKMKSDLEDLTSEDAISSHKYNSSESILALEDVFTPAARDAAFISDKMKAAFNKDNDLRFALYFEESTDAPGEYKVIKGVYSDSKCSFRVSEMYLIVAECAAKNDKLDQAKEYLNKLKAKRLKADFYTEEKLRIDGLGKEDLIGEIAMERFREFAMEGHRWFDLRRTTQESITHTYKGESTTLLQGDPRYTLPFPTEATNNNPNLNN